jgi:hypothetical protein
MHYLGLYSLRTSRRLRLDCFHDVAQSQGNVVESLTPIGRARAEEGQEQAGGCQRIPQDVAPALTRLQSILSAVAHRMISPLRHRRQMCCERKEIGLIFASITTHYLDRFSLSTSAQLSIHAMCSAPCGTSGLVTEENVHRDAAKRVPDALLGIPPAFFYLFSRCRLADSDLATEPRCSVLAHSGRSRAGRPRWLDLGVP